MHQVFTPGTIHTENLQPSQLLTNLTTSHPQECHPSQERIGLIKRWGKNHHCPLQNSLTLEGLPEKFPWLHDPIRSKPSSDFVPASKSDEKFDVHHDADATRAFDNKKHRKSHRSSVLLWQFQSECGNFMDQTKKMSKTPESLGFLLLTQMVHGDLVSCCAPIGVTLSPRQHPWSWVNQKTSNSKGLNVYLCFKRSISNGVPPWHKMIHECSKNISYMKKVEIFWGVWGVTVKGIDTSKAIFLWKNGSHFGKLHLHPFFG